MFKSHVPHVGELAVQRARGAAPDTGLQLQHMLHGSHVIPQQHALFFHALPYLAVAVQDARHRPWATLLVMTRAVSATANDTLSVAAVLAAADPVAQALASPPSTRLFFAGVGVDYSNRRRNKLSGVVASARVQPKAGGIVDVDLTLVTRENMGNCPKYITVRRLVPAARHPEAEALGGSLNAAARELLHRCSTVYLASCHTADEHEAERDMGLNHRGGPPGFIRCFEDGAGTHLVLPDYSGNQFYQSIGNVQTEPLVGLSCIDFTTGDILYVTGRARNVFDAEAEAIMPRATLVTVLTVDDAVLVRGALQLQMDGPETFSPYNPPLRLLATELAALGRPLVASAEATATLVGVERECTDVATFTFQLSQPAHVAPAGFAIFDFSVVLQREYQHMNPARPRYVNDDLVRSWTVTRASEDGTRLAVTVKRLPGGLMSNLLHTLPPLPHSPPLQVVFKGHGGGALDCFSGDGGRAPAVMLWLAAGVGITPFMALHREMRRRGTVSAVTLLFSCRGDERLLAREMEADPGVTVVMFDSSAQAGDAEGGSPGRLHRRRVAEQDVLQVAHVAESTAYMCGPPAYQKAARGWLHAAGLPAQHIREESFEF